MSETGGMESPEKKPQHRRWLKIVLVASLVLNLFMVGWIGARWAAHGWWQLGVSHYGDWPAAAGETWQRNRPAFEALRGDAASALSEVADTLDAEPFDQAAYDQAIGNLAGVGKQFLETGGLAMQELGGKLSADERARAAKRARRLAGRIEQGWGRRHRDY